MGWVRNIRRATVPASQTLIVWSSEPDTMVAPSGEKATECTARPCALLCFSALSSREAVASVGLSCGLGEKYGGLSYLHPRL